MGKYITTNVVAIHLMNSPGKHHDETRTLKVIHNVWKMWKIPSLHWASMADYDLNQGCGDFFREGPKFNMAVTNCGPEQIMLRTGFDLFPNSRPKP